MNLLELYNIVKKDYCSLFSYKMHPSSIEVITPIPTLGNSFVSVFLAMKKNDFVITDGGWLSDDTYETDSFSGDLEILDNVVSQYASYYGIKSTVSGQTRYYYRKTSDASMISRTIFDVSNFIAGVVNAANLSYKPKREHEEKDRFKTHMNDFLKENYSKRLVKRWSRIDGIVFSAAIKENNKIHLLEYISGHNKVQFRHEINRATVNFQLAGKSYLSNYLENKIAVINDSAKGYEDGMSSRLVIDYLREHTTTEFVGWSQRGDILKHIPV